MENKLHKSYKPKVVVNIDDFGYILAQPFSLLLFVIEVNY